MADLCFETPLSMDEIEDNFKNFDLTAALDEAIRDIKAWNRGEDVPGLVIHERTLIELN